MVTLMINNKTRIEKSLQSLSVGDFGHQVISLLDTLGYKSERILHDRFVTASEFVNEYRSDQSTQSEKSFLVEVKSVRVLFQLTDAEIDAKQAKLFDEKTFDSGKTKSFVFVAVELIEPKYVRGQYASFTREINKRFNMPVVVLFKTPSDFYTLSFVHRRKNQRDPTRYVLGPISLIREIESKKPSHAHIDILEALMMDERLKWIDDYGKPKNFDGLLDSWLNALDVEELNKRFYCELFAWFLHAAKYSKLPKTSLKSLKPEEHTLRLITRLLFIWFIKQKGLVAGDLFNENKIQTLLKNYDSQDGDSYYRVILQNLFFATLNTKITNRTFGNDPNNMSSYHYQNEMKDLETLRSLFNQTPFINGGLFDCLDDADGSSYIDYFVNDPNQRRDYSIPNFLFFNPREEGAKVKDRNKNSIPGIFTIFNKYHFTVEENTPLEQEVALDPELLGKVFENLLAAYNPETRETVRNQTGSYYTPRKIVDYMVDESLCIVLTDNVLKSLSASKKNKLTKKYTNLLENKIRNLLDYSSNVTDYNLTDIERKHIVHVISEIKIIDPAVGSGAFPMAVLHKLTLILNRVDTDNSIWERLQRDMARERIKDVFEHEDEKLRETQLHHINTVFEKYRDDFGRKLCLLQNNIYGVDIQPTAIQIAKLRFFISLAIEQDPTTNPNHNYGIHPLPNLETRFVAADTLTPLNKFDQYIQETLGQTDEVKQLEKLLLSNREQYFHATSLELKSKYKNDEFKLRKQLISKLNTTKTKAGHLDKIAHWDPYGQNIYSNWFDVKYMFGISNGFDIVIGNPPYISLQNNKGKLADKYENAGYETFDRTGDVYQLFFEFGSYILNKSGVLAYITSNSWLRSKYGRKTRLFFTRKYTPLQLIDMGKDVFDAIVDSSILLLREGKNQNINFKAVDMDTTDDKQFPPVDSLWKFTYPNNELPWSILSVTEKNILDKMQKKGIVLKNWDVKFNRGIETGFNTAFLINEKTKDTLVKSHPESIEIIKPVLRGKDIQRFQVQWANLYMIDTHNGYAETPRVQINNYPAVKLHLDQFKTQLTKRVDQGYTIYNLRDCTYYEDFKREKLLWIDLAEAGRFAYDADGFFCVNSAYILTGKYIKYLCAVLNSKLSAWFMRNRALTSGMGTPRWIKFTVGDIPIPQISLDEQFKFTLLVDRIIKAKSTQSNTQKLENKINKLVYDLYELTNDEIEFIESSK